MRSRFRFLILIVVIFHTSAWAGNAGDSEALQAMRNLQGLLRSQTSTATYTMRVVTPEWKRSVRFDAWDDRPGKRFFIHIASPKKDKGTSYLKLRGNLWLYLPKLERDIRIPPSMMLSSWMGSDFTNDDLVKSASVVEDYTHRIIARDENSITIESIPKPNAPVVWGKLMHVIRTDGIPLSEAFYDEHAHKRRMLTFEDVKELGGRRIPSRWVMHPLDEAGRQTILKLERVEFDPVIPDSIFTRANLKRQWR